MRSNHLVILLAAWLAACFPAVSDKAASSEGHNQRSDAREVSLRGVQFEIPANHLVLIEREPVASFIFEGLWPGLEPRTSETLALFAEPGGRSIRVHVVGEASADPSVSARRRLDAAVDAWMRQSVGPTEERPTDFGLVEHHAVGMRPGFTDNGGRYDYFEPVSEADEVHIRCGSELSDAPSNPQNAPCEQQWLYGNLYVKAFFVRRLLAEWASIRRSSEDKIDAFQR